MNSNKKTSLFSYQNSLWGIAVLFLMLYLLLSFYNRLAADDFYFLGAEKQIGTYACVKQSYFTFSGRWMAYSLTCWLLQFSGYSAFLFLFGTGLLVLLITSIYKLLEKLIVLSGIQLKNKERILFSIILCCSFFFANFGIGETWFWYTSVCSYLFSIIALLLLVNEITSSKNSIWSFPALVILALFIGGASESFALNSVLCLSILIVLAFSKNEKLSARITKSQRIKILLAFCFLVLSFSITALAPGNFLRLSFLPHPTPIQQLISPFKALAKIAFLVLTKQAGYLILFSLPWFFLGVDQKKSETISLKQFLIQIKLVPIGMLILLFVMLLPSTLLLNETPPVRALSQISLLLSLFIALLFFFVGKQVKINPSLVAIGKKYFIFISILLLIFTLLSQFRITKKYAKHYDERMEFLRKTAVTINTSAIELAPLPVSGMLYSAEISNDTAFYSNQHLQSALELKSGIRINKK